MEIFKYDIAEKQNEFERDGYSKFSDVLSDDFREYISAFLKEILSGRVEDLPKNRIKNHKNQYKFDFPSMEAAEEFRDAIADLTGINREKAKLSERHLMIYDQLAKDYPYPHKDRCASGITVGFPITLPEDTAIYLFPNMERGENPNEKASYLDETVAEDPQELYRSSDAIRIDQEFGDLVVFAGSTLYHGRTKPAGTAILYCKLNDVGRDPLGEDIFHQDLDSVA